MLRYVTLAVLWTFAGRGVLALTRTAGLGAVGWLLAPVLAQAFVTVVLGAGIMLGITTHVLSTPLWLAMIGLALVGVVSTWRSDVPAGGSNASRVGPALVAAASLAVPAVVLLPYFVHGFGRYAGTPHQDAWVYIAFGDYLWHYPRLTDVHLAPIYQFASAFGNSRFASPAQLGWLATLTSEGDSQAAFGLLLTLGTFIVGCACGAVALAFRLSAPLALLVIVTGGAGNWISNAVLISNLDNLLALSYLPALCALALAERHGTMLGRATLAGLLVASTTYAFPEFTLLTGWCAALHFVAASHVPTRERWTELGASMVVAAVLLLPAATHLAWFLHFEFTAGMSNTARPGQGLYGGLLDLHAWPAALWALGAEHTATAPSWTIASVAAAVSLLALAGLARLFVERRYATLVTLTTLATAFGIFAWIYDYGYGAYKFVLFGWWLLALLVALGVRECYRRLPAAGYAASLAAVALVASSATHAVRESAAPPRPDIGAYRAVRATAPLVNSAPIALAVANDEAARWASYFLRDMKTRLVARAGLFAAPFAARAMGLADPIPWTSLRLLLTDAIDAGPFTEQSSGWTPLWRSGHYTLWDTHEAGWAIVSSTDNGYPSAAGPDLVWIADQPVAVRVTASHDGTMLVDAKLALSQALSEAVPIRVATTDSVGHVCERRLAYAGFSLPLGLRAGENTVTLVKTAPTGIKVLAEADQRFPFMVGLLHPANTFHPGMTTPDCPQ